MSVFISEPLQAIRLPLGREFRAGIVQGRITACVRLGQCDFRCGPAMLCCERSPFAVLVHVTEVRYCKVYDVAHTPGFEKTGLKGWSDVDKLLRDDHPVIGVLDCVTLVVWDKPSGHFVTHADTFADDPESAYDLIDCG